MKDIREVLKEAHEEGMKAGTTVNVSPMIIVKDKEKIHIVADGVCGFASISFKGNTTFGRWMKKNGFARSSVMGGLYMSVPHFNQSLIRKEAYANAYVKVLGKYEITAYSESRMD